MDGFSLKNLLVPGFQTRIVILTDVMCKLDQEWSEVIKETDPRSGRARRHKKMAPIHFGRFWQPTGSGVVTENHFLVNFKDSNPEKALSWCRKTNCLIPNHPRRLFASARKENVFGILGPGIHTIVSPVPARIRGYSYFCSLHTWVMDPFAGRPPSCLGKPFPRITSLRRLRVVDEDNGEMEREIMQHTNEDREIWQTWFSFRPKTSHSNC